MKVGLAQINITPKPGIDLAGYAIRPQPSTAILDSLFARALHLIDGPEQLLWLHCDLMALGQAAADQFRDWCQAKLGIPRARVIISTSHTHSAPVTLANNECGRVDPSYFAWLNARLREAASEATADSEECGFLHVEGACHNGRDRSLVESAQLDRRVAALAWARADGTFKAILVSHPMHPICMRASEFSADWPGETARILSRDLPGQPACLVFSGACGNIIPPDYGVPAEKMRGWGRQVAEAVADKLNAAAQKPISWESGLLQAQSTSINLQLDPSNLDALAVCAAARDADEDGRREFGEKYDRALAVWRDTMTRILSPGDATARAELSVIKLGEVSLITVNAEIFSSFSALVGGGREFVYAIGCSNGILGYLPTAAAFDEGGYEVDRAMMFYNMPRLHRDSMEILASHARLLLNF